MAGAPVEALKRVPLFIDLDPGEIEQIARLFKERHFSQGETVTREGSGGAAFFLIESGQATVSVAGAERAMLKQGDHFGEIALIDEGPRSATIVASTELVCYGLTFWDFRPLVQENGAIGWKLLQVMVQKLRAAEQGYLPDLTA
jgi:CRP-like cAMP-binding protein